jgi:hypothetical protein
MSRYQVRNPDDEVFTAPDGEAWVVVDDDLAEELEAAGSPVLIIAPAEDVDEIDDDE